MTWRRYVALVKTILSLLSFKDRYKFYALAGINLLMSGLDLLGVVALGILTSVAVQGEQSLAPGNRTTKILDFIGLSQQDYTEQIVFLAFSAVILFVFKVIFSAYFTRKTIRFLSFRAVEAGLATMNKLLGNTTIPRQKMSSQEMAYAVNVATSYGVVGVLGGIAKLASEFTLMFIMILTLLLVDFQTAATTVLVFGFVSLLLTRKMRLRARKLGKDYFKHFILLNEITLGTFAAAREIWVRSSELYFLKRVKSERDELAKIESEQMFLGIINKYVFEITLIFLTFFVCFIQLSSETPARAAGTITIFLASIFRIGPAALSSQQILIQLQTYFAKIEKTINSIQALPNVNLNPIEKAPHQSFSGLVELENVYFKHSDQSNFELKDISFSILPGEFVAIVGASGSGKSTLMDIMLGLLIPDKGKCLISGLQSNMAVRQFPGEIGFVPQEAQIVPGSIRENILLGLDPHQFPHSELDKVLKLVRLESLIKKLPQGIDEFIGEGGIGLSGGEKQRLSLARSLVTNPKILLLDEATSALDAETETAISESLNSLVHSKSIIVISHKISTIMNADKIVFLDEGRVESIGTFEGLRRACPKFELFASLQGL